MDEVLEEMYEYVYAEKLFCERPRLDYQVWLRKCEGNAEFNQLWYDPQKIRELFFSIVSGEYGY